MARGAVATRQEPSTDHALIALDQEIERRRATLEASAASLIDPRRLKGVVLAAFTRTPALWECDPISIARAVVEAAQYGLEPTGAIGGAHLVPFFNKRTGKKEAQLIIDYRGYVQLARRSGEVGRVEARVVREQDSFSVDLGTNPGISHVPYIGSDDPGKYTHVYAVITYRDGTPQFDFDTWAWVQTIKKRAKAGDNGPWVTDEPEMAKKSILRRLMKLAPLTIEARRAIEFEERDEAEVAAVADRRGTSQGRAAPGIARIHERLGMQTTEEPLEAEVVDVSGPVTTAPLQAGSDEAEAVLPPRDEPPPPVPDEVAAESGPGRGPRSGTLDVNASQAAQGSDSAASPCTGFHKELGKCVREEGEGHAGLHANKLKETWR